MIYSHVIVPTPNVCILLFLLLLRVVMSEPENLIKNPKLWWFLENVLPVLQSCGVLLRLQTEAWSLGFLLNATVVTYFAFPQSITEKGR